MAAGTQFLLFSIGADRYALAAKQVREIFPAFDVKGIPGAPKGVIGVLDYHGKVIPVVDLSLMLVGCAARRGLSTRFLVVDLVLSNKSRPVALLLERVTEIVSIDEAAFQPPRVNGVECLSLVYASPRGVIQRIEVERLLSPEALAALWRTMDNDFQD